MWFIIFFVFLISIGLCFFWACVDRFGFKHFYTAISVFVIIISFFLLFISKKEYKQNLYNTEEKELFSSEHHYHYEQAVGHRHSTSYIYKCDDCDKILETTNYFNLKK